MDLIMSIQRSRTPFVFDIRLIPFQSVLNTDTDESWHTLCVRLPNACFVSHCTLPDRCTAEANAQMQHHCQSTCRLFYPMCFLQYSFSLDATLKFILLAVILCWFGHRPGYYTTIDFWFGLERPSDAKSSVISQMSLSQYYMFGV